MKNNYIQSPLNYTGGKYKLLNQLIPLFPKNINTFIDLFGGGGGATYVLILMLMLLFIMN